MPVKIYDISKKLGLENKEILAKAQTLGIAARVPSSSLDKITAEYLEGELRKDHPELTASPPPPPLPVKSQVSITATGSEIYNLVERILNGEVQFRFDVFEAETGEPLRLCLAKDKDANQKTLGTKPKLDLLARTEIDERTRSSFCAAYFSSKHKSSEGWVNLAEFGNQLKALDPGFQSQDFGERSLGSLLRRVTDMFELRNDESNPIVYYLRMRDEKFRALTRVPTQAQPNVALQTTQAAAPTPARLARGKIHNLKLGFGFIMPDDGSENLFFHATDVEGCTIFDLQSGDAVEYEPGMNEKGPCGRKVRRLKAET